MAISPAKVHVGVTVHPVDSPRWLAVDESGLGHAFERGAARSLCAGVRSIEERWAWPLTERCEACVLRTEPPDVQRQMWGR
jgi:hypothetical protein